MVKVLYLGEIGYRNAGDDVMWDVFKRQIARFGPKNIGTLVACRQEYARIPDYDVIVLGGGSLLAPGYLSLLDQARRLGKPTYIWGSGVDRLAGRAGLTSALEQRPLPQGALDSHTAELLHRNIKHARRVLVRGPLSHAFLQAAGADASKIQISGDPAFLLKPGDAARGLWLPTFKKDAPVVGINWGTAFNNIHGNNEERVENQLATAAKSLIQQGHSILLYSVWPDDIPACRRLEAKINGGDNVKFVSSFYPYQVLSIVARCRYTINFKLHAAIFSAAMGVPFIALGYRFKIYDFAASLSLLPFVIATDRTDIQSEVVRLAAELEINRAPLIRKMSTKISQYDGLLTSAFFAKIGERS